MPILTDRVTQLAREACAAHFDELGAHHTANRFREGKRDDCPYLDVARRAVEAVVGAAAGAVMPAPTAIERELRHIELYGCGSEARAKIVEVVPVFSAPYGVTASGRPRDLDECD